eukprot:CAMPEP_0118936656 /NCGR_PEP_ID=MMETSP1169-20130426/19859_1 /TAXON_ID=36882 /ORGANISM="Pyramimonas obovata, Strain CCMP722" /LENGTH=38 /DNA_ID= /DNA_START= /DNA_END= /DNA_ORIENTATION=
MRSVCVQAVSNATCQERMMSTGDAIKHEHVSARFSLAE